MVKKIRNFLKKNFLLTASLMFLVVFSGTMQLFAAAPSGGYAPGATLDPDCAPGSTDCIVAQAVYNAGDIVYDNSTSGLTAIDTQAAIDELDNTLDGIDSSPISVVNSSNLFSTGLTGAGSGASSVGNSIFFGQNAGNLAIGSDNSIFFGGLSGYHTTNADYSNFLGDAAGKEANSSANSNFIGQQAGHYATNSFNSNFLGQQAGLLAVNANNSNFFGYDSGYSTNGANNSNFFGQNAGYFASANNSNFFGQNAGYSAGNAGASNFFGQNAGYSADNAGASNFLGYNAGHSADNAANSNFFGTNAGKDATAASFSNFFGIHSGELATNAFYSNFFGVFSGTSAVNAAHSIFIGYNAGVNDTVDNRSSGTSILIGDNTSTGGFSNSIALGEGAINTLANQFKIGSVSTPIDKTVWVGTSGAATLDTATGLITTSDERLKQNIVDLDNTTLEKLLNIKTVTFNWKKGDTDKTNIGFIAQDLEQYFPELVYTNGDGLKGVNYANMTPVIVEAIRELDLKVEDLIIEKQNLFNNLVAWFGNVENGIEKLFAKEIHTDMICVKKSDGTERCVTGDELDQVLSNSGLNNIIPTQEPIGSNNAGDVTEEGIDGTAPNEAQNPTTETPQSETPPSDTSTIDTTNPTESA